MVAMVGGGQLARMTHQSAIALGMSLRVLAVSPEDPAAQVSPDVVLGAHTDLEALRTAANGAAALTFDHEHVPGELLETLVDEGVPVLPGPQACATRRTSWRCAGGWPNWAPRCRGSPRCSPSRMWTPSRI